MPATAFWSFVVNDAIIGLGQTQVLRLKRHFQVKKRSCYYFKPFSGCCRPYRTLQIKVQLPAFVPPEMQSVITCVMCNNVFCFFNASVPSSDSTQNLLWGFVLTKLHNSDYFYSCAQIKY